MTQGRTVSRDCEQKPLVSVVMGIYNAGPYVGDAVSSLLCQSLQDFELILVDDGSTDDSGAVLRSFEDDRIVLVENGQNLGLTRSLNIGLERAKGKYIARLDADDVALPSRLERQVAYLEAHPDVGCVGSPVIYIGPDGRELGVQRVRSPDVHRALLAGDFCWEHSSTLFQAACIEAVGPYRGDFRYAQDYDLWLRIAEHCHLVISDEPLVRLRLHPHSISVTKSLQQRAFVELAILLAKQRREQGQEDPHALHDGALRIASGDSAELDQEQVGQLYLKGACLHYLLGDTVGGQEKLTQGVAHDPSLLTATDRTIDLLIYYALDHATDRESNLGAVRFLNRLFSTLPASAQDLGRMRNRALARLHTVSAFDSFDRSEPRQATRDVLSAVIRDPSLLRNRGIWSVFARSLLGRARA